MADGLADRRLLVTSPGVRSCIRASGAAPDLCGRGSHALMENRNRRKSSWPRSGRTSVGEWAVPGSNQRPPACKAGALPTELTARRGQCCRRLSGEEIAARETALNRFAAAPERIPSDCAEG